MLMLATNPCVSHNILDILESLPRPASLSMLGVGYVGGLTWLGLGLERLLGLALLCYFQV